jgi:hypothetical protein
MLANWYFDFVAGRLCFCKSTQNYRCGSWFDLQPFYTCKANKTLLVRLMCKRVMMFRGKIVARNALISIKIHKLVMRLYSLGCPLVKVG